MDVAVRYEFMGMSPEDIIIASPQLKLSQIHDALSYYYEHKEEIDRIWRDSICRRKEKTNRISVIKDYARGK